MVCVIGEALIDLVADRESAQRPGPRSYLAHPGGSPYNVAIGLARLDRPTALQARLSRDAFGRQLRAHAEANGVDLSLAIDAPEPSTLAIVGLDEQRNATYDFYLNGTADWQWTASELDRAPRDNGWIHTGSLASWTQPGASVIGKHLALRRSAGATVSYDPNIRPLLMPDHAAAVASVEDLVRLADVVKASAEDLEWLYPGRGLTEVMPAWQALGPSIVAITDGARGAHGIGPAGSIVTVPALRVEVIDTVGAGDAFMAGLINALCSADVSEVARSAEGIAAVLNEAMLVAALTVTRAGANPPTAAELLSARSTTPPSATS